MKIDNALILKLEQLAQLDLEPVARKSLQSDLNEILKMIEKLNDLKDITIEPMRSPTRVANVFRADDVTQIMTSEQALKNAPLHDDEHFLVPKVIKK